jgi:hypothetical protein
VTRGDLARLEAKLDLFTKRLPPPARRGLTEKTKNEHRKTIEQYFGGNCPCCGKRGVLGSRRGEFDHFTDNRNRNGAHETWLICVECHESFSRGLLRRDEHRTHFDFYQIRLREANCKLPGL